MAVDVDVISYVRLLITDTDDANPLLTDMEVSTLVTANAGDALLAAADALDIIATSEVLVSKKIRTQDLATDGPAVSAELRALADRLRARAQATADAVDDIFDVVPTGTSCRPSWPERADREVWGL